MLQKTIVSADKINSSGYFSKALRALFFATLTQYLLTTEWKDKAGAYAIQGYAEKFIKRINGSYSNVVGLPLFETYNLLNSQGLI